MEEKSEEKFYNIDSSGQGYKNIVAIYKNP